MSVYLLYSTFTHGKNTSLYIGSSDIIAMHTLTHMHTHTHTHTHGHPHINI